MAAKTVDAALNDQMAAEFHAAHLYLSMAAYFDQESLPGFARWMRAQYEEETGHAMKLYDYILYSGRRVVLKGVEQPPNKFASPLKVMQHALRHEKAVTKSINDLYVLAQKANDYPTQLELQWFIREQLEEEKTFDDIIARMKLAGEDGAGLLLIDSELGGRTTGK